MCSEQIAAPVQYAALSFGIEPGKPQDAKVFLLVLFWCWKKNQYQNRPGSDGRLQIQWSLLWDSMTIEHAKANAGLWEFSYQDVNRGRNYIVNLCALDK